MVVAAGVLMLAVMLVIAGRWAAGCQPAQRTVKIARPLAVVIDIAPLAGVVVFALLFAFVLHGRLAERAVHAFAVLGLWLCATRFYQYILEYFRYRRVLAVSAVGMAAAAALAVLLTPLDRYCTLVYVRLSWCSAILDAVVLAAVYASAYMARRTPEHK